MRSKIKLREFKFACSGTYWHLDSVCHLSTSAFENNLKERISNEVNSLKEEPELLKEEPEFVTKVMGATMETLELYIGRKLMACRNIRQSL